MKRMITYSMSTKLNKIGDDLDRKGKPLIRHLIKFALYSNHRSSDHWADEIYSFIKDVDTYKGKNKAPSEEFIFRSLYTRGNYRYLHKWIKVVKEDYGDSDVSDQNVEEFVKSYLEWLSEELSTNLTVSRSSVRNELLKLS